MAQSYKVYINDKEIIFTRKELINTEDDSILKYFDPSVNDIHVIISDFAVNPKYKGLILSADNPEEIFKAFRKDYKLVRAAGGLVRDNDKRVLCIFRRGKWDLPKGKIDKDEKKMHAALREVREETGLNELIIVRRLENTYHTYTDKHAHILKKTYWYEMAAVRPEPLIPQAEEEITKICWFKPEELGEVHKNTYTSISRILERLRMGY